MSDVLDKRKDDETVPEDAVDEDASPRPPPPSGLRDSLFWLVGRHRWLLMLTMVALALVGVMRALGLVNVSDSGVTVGEGMQRFGEVFFVARVVLVPLALTVGITTTARFVAFVSRSPALGAVLRRGRWRVLMFYVVFECLVFLL